MRALSLYARLVFSSLLFLTNLLAFGEVQDMRIRKKLIATGWDHADSQRLLENLNAMEKRPFDGVVIQLTGHTEEKRPCQLRRAFVNEKWRREWFQPCIDRLNACRFKRFTDNFVLLGANPGDVDWFDEEGWQEIIEHWRIAAWVVRQSGFRGILFDPEPYTKPYSQFRYAAQSGRDKHTFNEYYSKARRRGQEVMRAVGEEYPNITVFCYFMNSVNAVATGHTDPRQALAASGYGLYPAFIDGWLDAVPATVTLVDGCESAYRYNSEGEYLEAAVRIKGACQELVSHENRARYRAQVQVSFGVYMDAYWNPDGPWQIDGLGGPRVERLRANVQCALRVADEYVWVYGEKFRWWPTPNRSVRKETWPEALPGCEEILRFVRDPVEYARSEIASLGESGKLVNLARNGDFGSKSVRLADGTERRWKEGGVPAGWGAWQEKTSHGTFAWDREAGAAGKGAARAAMVMNGCFIQEHNVQPGERYVVRAVRKIQGRGEAWTRIRWKTSDEAWTATGHDRLILCASPQNAWGEMFGVVEVPKGAGRLVILLGIRDQTTENDVAWYDDVELYRLE